MAQPTAYTPITDYSDFEASNVSFTGLGVKLDIEFAALNTSLDETLANLALIQRDDGALLNGIVTAESLATGLSVGVTAAGAWVTATAYVVNDMVWESSKLYIAKAAHTSGVFATDLAANWTEILDLPSEVPTATGIFINTVVTKVNADSPYTVLEGDNGKAFDVDTSSGDVNFTLPEISGLTNGSFFRILLKKTVAANSMVSNRSGSDTINGATSDTYTAQHSAVLYYSQSGDTDWKKIDLSPTASVDAQVTNAKNITFYNILTC